MKKVHTTNTLFSSQSKPWFQKKEYVSGQTNRMQFCARICHSTPTLRLLSLPTNNRNSCYSWPAWSQSTVSLFLLSHPEQLGRDSTSHKKISSLKILPVSSTTSSLPGPIVVFWPDWRNWLEVALHPPSFPLPKYISVISVGIITKGKGSKHTPRTLAGQGFPECLSSPKPAPCACVVKPGTGERWGRGKCCPKNAYHSFVLTGICS